MNIYHQAPRYSTIAASLAADIEEGRYPVGTALPTETELRMQYGVSRHTVREALRELKDRGLIASRSGVGTHVRARPSEQRFIHGVSSLEQLLQVVESTEQQVLRTREITADSEFAKTLRCNVGRRWLEVLALRRVVGEREPIGMVTSYIPPEHAGVIPAMETAHQPLFYLVEQHGGSRVMEIRQEILATTLDAEQAKLLHAAPKDNALMIIRHHLDEHDEVIQAAIGVYPQGRSSYVTQFRVHRGQAGQS
ncbi:GntR family transcriptional regulator [Pusillimonas sp. SM2304]|uniref:GntR family transcriptional regulator n=1 Tax=Pusillimonas sp. SM2304 TaxID=3073241 RepID=UPI002875B7FA|nr:GntR family transcriptional regulator [Pusillimonas sp. SM2304]MDS1139866.1 GntR family transcriptional regulator [Pusillimonas sp. SM2304]